MAIETLPPFLATWDSAHRRAGAQIPDAVVEQVRRNWFDTVAATAGGVAQNYTRAALQASTGDGVEALRAADAALVLGAATGRLYPRHGLQRPAGDQSLGLLETLLQPDQGFHADLACLHRAAGAPGEQRAASPQRRRTGGAARRR